MKDAISAIGLDYDQCSHQRLWTTEEIKEALISFKRIHGEIYTRKLREHAYDLYGATRLKFGSLEAAASELGISDVLNIPINRRDWTKESVINALREIKESGGPINYVQVYARDSGLMRACKELFGSYEVALSELDVTYKDVRIDRDESRYLGAEFERIGHKILQECGVDLKDSNYVKTSDSYILPDAISKDGKVFYDFKLSSWSFLSSKTVEKYTDYCDKLLLIYCRGSHIDVKNDKVQSISIDSLVENNHISAEVVSELDRFKQKLNEECCK